MNKADVLSPRLGMSRFSSPPHCIAAYHPARSIALRGMIFVNFKYLIEAEEYGTPFQIWLSNLLDGRPAVTFHCCIFGGRRCSAGYCLEYDGRPKSGGFKVDEGPSGNFANVPDAVYRSNRYLSAFAHVSRPSGQRISPDIGLVLRSDF
jgi:hypothetical protein